MNKIRLFLATTCFVMLLSGCARARTLVIKNATEQHFESITITSVPGNHYVDFTSVNKEKDNSGIEGKAKISSSIKDNLFEIEITDAKGNKYLKKVEIDRKEIAEKLVQIQDSDIVFINLKNSNRFLSVKNGTEFCIIKYELEAVDDLNLIESKKELNKGKDEYLINNLNLRNSAPECKLFKITAVTNNGIHYEKTFEMEPDSNLTITIVDSDYVEREGDWRKLVKPYKTK